MAVECVAVMLSKKRGAEAEAPQDPAEDEALVEPGQGEEGCNGWKKAAPEVLQERR